MADNIRDVLRAAQAAELGGDKERAISLLRKAAQLYRRAGNATRAEQLLRYALRLDPSRLDLEEEIARGVAPDERTEEGRWIVDPGDAEFQTTLREAELSLERRTQPLAVAVEAVRSAVTALPVAELRAVEPRAAEPRAAEPRKDVPPAPPAPPASEGEGAFIERGPTRADPSLEAWCSFCCRPRAEVGPLVAGPAGAFICSACTGESGALLGGVTPASGVARERPSTSRPVTLELVGQERARERLERSLALGVRRVLLLGPEGCGKSTWMRMLGEQGWGVLVTPATLDEAAVNVPLLVEDVDRLSPGEQGVLGAFLTRHPQRTVLMTTRGGAGPSGLVLVSDEGALPVPSTAALSEATGGGLPLALLEQVQLLVTLEPPGVEDLCEIARRRLAAREDCQLSEQALEALATEAARSPRRGHELGALLARVPPGAWRLEEKKTRTKPPARRGRRKGTS